MRHSAIAGICLVFLVAISFGQQPESPLVASWKQHTDFQMASPYQFNWTQLGPTINSARAEAVQIDITQPGTMYVAFGSGGLWKTTNNGLTWRPIFENQPSLGIGDIALAPSNPDILYVGTGESLKKARNFTMTGTGVYRSKDAGDTWQHIGLNDSWHIGEIVVHPDNPNTVFVAVQGHFWSSNPHRGLYRTRDAGKTWEHVLYVDEHTGANDVVFSPADPDVLYASMWHNYPGLTGANSGVYVSHDGGDSWERGIVGFPVTENIGRIGVAVSHQDPQVGYAFVDHRNKAKPRQAAEVYRTNDGGKSWMKTHEHPLSFLSVIGWYFMDIYVNPDDHDEVFALGVRVAHSTDGGKNFAYIGGDVRHMFPSVTDPLHLDHCEMWIHPENPQHLALCNDGGLYVTYDKGETWTHFNNIPVGEFYDISLDHSDPYLVYGGTQDNATVYGPADPLNEQFFDGWRYLWTDPWSGGDGCITAIDAEDPNTLYFSAQEGNIYKLNKTTGSATSIKPNHKRDNIETEYNFISPYLISLHDNKALYLGGKVVMKSNNKGDSWEVISPDLTESSIVNKVSHAIGALAESPLREGLLYAGTDRGAFWVSDNGGRSWKERSAGLRDHYIRCIAPSQHRSSTVFLTMSGINYDELGAALYRSDNRGRSWRPLTAGIADHEVYVVKEDPVYNEVLYAGTYRGVYLSINGGNSWHPLGKRMPMAAVADLEIDVPTLELIAATHGRGMYKLSLRALHEWLDAGTDNNFLCTPPAVPTPTFHWTMNGVDYRSHRHIPLTFWAMEQGHGQFSVVGDTSTIWTTPINYAAGFNELMWDQVVARNENDNPYFVNYTEFIPPGTYELRLDLEDDMLVRKLEILPSYH